MNALEFIAGLLTRGVSFAVVGDRLRVYDPGRSTTPTERALLGALKPTLRGLLATELPAERPQAPCPGFNAAAGVALCRTCGHSLPEHFWRRSTCEFFAGAPATNASCRRCGIPWLEHVGSGAPS